MHFLDWRGMICFLFRVPLGKPLKNTNNPWEDVNKEITQIDKHCEWTWKNSWPFPQFTTSANKGEAWECSAYILPTSNIDKDPLFLFLKFIINHHLYKKPCPWSECRGSTASRSWAGSLPPRNFASSQTHICPKLGSCRPGCICQRRGREPRSHLQRREVNAIYNNFEKKTRKTFEWKGL